LEKDNARLREELAAANNKLADAIIRRDASERNSQRWMGEWDQMKKDRDIAESRASALRAKVERVRDHIERGGAHPELTAAVVLCGEILGYYPAAEAGPEEKK
jgi:hypothetical protein